ncbi:MAG: SpaA isopeptide-forming pilin-related protein, partial [Saprospiraceae bacterium]|nr:SpaA isopeptide-forming pilin-related protein [Saprospiraceae bacterium]
MYNTPYQTIIAMCLTFSLSAGIWNVADAQPDPICDDCFGTTGDCALPPVASNPDVTAECPVLKIIFILDESGSIAAAGAQPDVEEGVLAFLSGLSNTGAEVALVEFAHQAHLVSDFVEVDPDFIDDVQGYFDGTALNGQIYNAGGSTNWHSAMDTALALGSANLILFFTDGDPTSYMTGAGTVSVCISSGSTQRPEMVNPMKVANYFKDSLSTHIFMLGVGSVNLDTLTNLSGPVAWQPGVNDVMTSDYALESFTTLAQGLADFAHDLCGTEVAMDMLAPANPVCAGEVVSLTIKVVNTGTENAAVDLLVRDTFPAGVTDITCTTNCGSVCIATACDPDVPSNTLEWFVGNLPPGDSAQLTVEVTTMTPGIHTNFAWVFANNVDTSSAMGMIEVLDTPLVDVGLDVEICSGGTAMLTANGSAGTGPYSYNWSNGSAGAENAVSPAVSTQYTVTVTDANLCSATAEIVVNVVDDPLVMSMSDDTTICDGGFALLTSSVLGGTGATEFQWQLYDSIQGWMDITGADSSVLQTPTLTPGVYAYRLSVEQGSGCSAVSGMIAVTVVDDPIVALSVDHPEVCVGGSTRITAQVNGGSSELAYQWQLSHDGVAWTNVGTNTSIHDAPADSAGTFWYRVILTDLANGCNDPVSDSTAVSVVEDATVTLTADEAEVCVDGVINLTTIITGGSAALTIQWQSSNDSINGWTNIPGATDTVYQPPTGTSGVIYYRTVVTDSTSGCSTPDFDIFPVTVYEDPAVLISADVGEVCIGGAAQLSAALTGGSSQLSYHWQASENGVGGWADIGVTNVPFSPPTDSAGTYYYRVRLEDVSAGCNETESNALAFVVRDTSSASVSADTYTPCQGDMVTLQATIAGGSSALSYHWQTSPDGMAPWTDVGVADANYNPPTTTPGPHYFRVRVEDTTSGCNEPVSEALILQVLEPPVASVDHDDAFCYLPNGVINVTFADHPDRDSIEFSLDNQASYQPAVADAAGSQIFAGLAPGTYAVWGRWSEEECPVFLDSVTVVNIPCGTICGKVLDDQLNPISNVKIWLYPDTNGDGNADGQPIDSTYTEGDAGSYCFEDIPIGDYVVVEEQPANYDDVRDYDHLRDSLDTDGVDTLIVVGMDTIVQLADNDIPVTLHADEYDEGNWFIEDPHTGEIQGWVIDDQYTPLPGLKMYLHDDVDQDGNADPLIVDSTTTNVLGHYQFTGVEPGFYVLISEQPAQYSDVSDVDTSIVLLLDEDGDDSADGPDNNIPVRVLPGELDKDNLFVDGRPGSICGQVRMDTGQPLELVTIELYADTDGDGNRDGSPLASIQTDSTGQYCFGNIQPADYVLYEIQPANYDSLSDYDRSITVDDPDGVDTTGVGADNDIPVTLAPGETDADNDFVEDPHLGNITGFVYDDIEAKLSGVTIELYADVNADGIKDSLVATRVTDGFGNFDFTGYEPGVYILEQIQPFLYGDILDRDTTITLADPDGDDGAEGPNNQIPVVLSAGETDADNAFQEGRPGSICGTVYDDQLNPISNVVLYLYADTTGDGNPDGAPLDSTVSDGDSGNYCFSDLEGGNYVVQEVQPENYDDLSDIDLSITASDPDGDDGPVPDNDIPVTLDWGEEDVNNDFIEDPHPGTIQGSVLDDIGQPITGVTIKLFSDTDGDSNADGPAIDSTVSNLSGAFAFTGV